MSRVRPAVSATAPKRISRHQPTLEEQRSLVGARSLLEEAIKATCPLHSIQGSRNFALRPAASDTDMMPAKAW